jgi:hypothetical protein
MQIEEKILLQKSKTFLPCLFSQDISYKDPVSHIPIDILQKLQKMDLTDKEQILSRYRSAKIRMPDN